MADFISREDARAFAITVLTSFGRIDAVPLDDLDELPAADVRPVVRGEWKKAYADHEAFGVRPFYRYCSKCHEATVHQYNFCPNCGADMREETDG